MPRDLTLQHFVEPAVDRIADHADRVRARHHHRPAEDAALDDPGRAGHLAEAVSREPSGKHRLPDFSPREDSRNAGANRTLADDKGPAALDQRDMTDLDAGDVGNGVERTGGSREWYAQLAGAGTRLSDERQREAGHHGAPGQHDESLDVMCARHPRYDATKRGVGSIQEWFSAAARARRRPWLPRRLRLVRGAARCRCPTS